MPSPPRTFAFRSLQGSWGIAIDLTAQAFAGAPETNAAEPVGTHIWLAVSTPLPEADRRSLLAGLASVASRIDAVTNKADFLIEVQRVQYTPTDYQVEGLAAAIIGWACEEFQLGPPGTSVTFDPEKNRYHISY